MQEEETLRSAKLQLKYQELEEKLVSAQVREVGSILVGKEPGQLGLLWSYKSLLSLAPRLMTKMNRYSQFGIF